MYEVNNLKHQKKLVEEVKKQYSLTKFSYWGNVADEMNKVFEEHSPRETWRTRYRVLTTDITEKNKKAGRNRHYNFDKEERLIAYLKKECTTEYLCRMLDMEEIELLGCIQKLQMKGHIITNTRDKFVISKGIMPNNEELKIQVGETRELEYCVISDTHIGNKKQQESLLNYVYDECVKKGIKTVFHCGDISDGQSNRPEHIYELFVHGADEISEYIIDHYPRRDDITTYFILGNHDAWLYKSGGVDIGKTISKSREDMIYLGFQKARVVLNNCKIDLFHPLDGTPYAKSYSGQKTIESMRGGNKPNVMFAGHHHKAVYFVDRNVHYCEVPCLCEATKWIEGKRIENVIGALFVKMTIDELGNVIRFLPEFQIFYNTLQNDYKIEPPKIEKEYVLTN